MTNNLGCLSFMFAVEQIMIQVSGDVLHTLLVLSSAICAALPCGCARCCVVLGASLKVTLIPTHFSVTEEFIARLQCPSTGVL
jgi:hypothetical protein